VIAKAVPVIDPKALYDSNDVTWLRKPDREVEGPWVERKETFDASEIARQISAFANGQPPGGLIVVGSDRDGLRVGLGAGRQKAYADLSKIPVDGHSWLHRFLPVEENDEILFIFVPFSGNRVVCKSDGKAFVRKGASTVELNTDETQELRYARGERRFENEPILRYTTSEVDPTVAHELLAGIRERNGLSYPQTIEDALANKGLTIQVGSDVHLTVAGLLAVGHKPTSHIPGAQVHFQRFDGTTERFGEDRNVTKERWFEGPTKQMLQDVQDFVGTLVSDFDHLGPDGVFVTEPEYPRTAWEEAIVNAVAHRSYSLRNAPIEIRMFDDRLEIESPGGYPGAQRPSPEGIFPISYPRNPNLGHALRYLGLVRLAKEGTRRMSEEMKKMGLPPPAFEEIQRMAVRVTLRNDAERRRTPRPEAGRWAEVVQNLRQDLAIYRRRALRTWGMLRNSTGGTVGAPSEVIEEVERLLKHPEIQVEERRTLLDMLGSEPDAGVAGLASRLVENLDTPFVHSIADPALRGSAATLVARSDEATRRILDLLNSQLIPDIETQRFGFDVLVNRLLKDPLPPPEWMNRALSASRKYPRDMTQNLYSLITGVAQPES
jgi:ATP-dependent DNA helicase RecG